MGQGGDVHGGSERQCRGSEARDGVLIRRVYGVETPQLARLRDPGFGEHFGSFGFR